MNCKKSSFNPSHTHTHTQADSEIPLIQKLYDLYKLIYQYTKLFPKYERFTLGQKIENITLEILDSTIQASILPKLRKIPYLEEAIGKNHTLKILLRMACELDVLDYRKYEQLEILLHEIGKMLGGWKRSLL